MFDYDAIIVGAGSVGVPAAMAMGEKNIKTLVLDWRPSPGQGQNKHAIGGIRATHSDPAKILTSQRCLEIFSTWKERFGDDIEWLKGGYTFPVYRKEDEKALRSILPIQKQYGLNIDFVGPDKILKVIPGINPKGLIGGTVSPDDGSASPLLSINAFYRRALSLGVTFQFKEKVTSIMSEGGKVLGVTTESKQYAAPIVIDAAVHVQRTCARPWGSMFPSFRTAMKVPLPNRWSHFLQPWWLICDLLPVRKITIFTRTVTDRWYFALPLIRRSWEPICGKPPCFCPRFVHEW